MPTVDLVQEVGGRPARSGTPPSTEWPAATPPCKIQPVPRHRCSAHLAAVDRGDPNRALVRQTDPLTALSGQGGRGCKSVHLPSCTDKPVHRKPSSDEVSLLPAGTSSGGGNLALPSPLALRMWLVLRLSGRRASEHPERDRADREHKRLRIIVQSPIPAGGRTWRRRRVRLPSLNVRCDRLKPLEAARNYPSRGRRPSRRIRHWNNRRQCRPRMCSSRGNQASPDHCRHRYRERCRCRRGQPDRWW
jgi:hypothetical protein